LRQTNRCRAPERPLDFRDRISAKVINTYQPAGKIEDFFQALAKIKDLPTREQAIEKSYTAEKLDGLKSVFEAHGMTVTGPPLDVHSNQE
jgi:hypothetical protein